jgi:hypothetical protein
MPGTGKTLLVNGITIVVLGHDAPIATLNENDEENQKQLTAQLRTGEPIICLDNVSQLRSERLCAMITSKVWSGRLLGKTAMLKLPNDAIWVATGNNVEMTTETARRCVRIRLNAEVERPWERRKKWRHDPLCEWALDNRGRLIHAALVCIQYWIANGRPGGSAILGGFEPWSRIIGGILECIGVGGFLSDQEQLYEAADGEAMELGEFCSVWLAEHGESWVSVSQLLEVAQRNGLLGELFQGKKEGGHGSVLGKKLRQIRDRVIGDLRVEWEANKHSKSARYRLARTAGTTPRNVTPCIQTNSSQVRGTAGGNLLSLSPVHAKSGAQPDELSDPPQPPASPAVPPSNGGTAPGGNAGHATGGGSKKSDEAAPATRSVPKTPVKRLHEDHIRGMDTEGPLSGRDSGSNHAAAAAQS